MGSLIRFTDTLKNLVANLGTSRDKASASYYAASTLSDLDLINAYRYAWLPRKIVEVPARDALRNWREWQAEPEEIEKIERLEKELKLRDKLLEARIKANLFGGAGIYIATNTTAVDQPMGANETVRGLTVMTRRQLTATELDTDPASEWFGLPKAYQVANSALQIHPSRLIRFVGKPFPDAELVAGTEFGWGDSVLTSVYQAVISADSTGANIASLVFEAKVDVIKIPQFMANLQDPEYEAMVLNRAQLAAAAKGINGMLLLDAEEDYEQKGANFGGLNELWHTALQVCAGASDIPITRLLGQSPGGLQSTGESDMRNYYDMVSAIQELDIEPALEIFDRLLIRNALRKVGEDIWYKWAPLWQPTIKERTDIGKTVADTIKTLSDTQLFDPVALSESGTSALVQAGVMPGLDQIDSANEDDDTLTAAAEPEPQEQEQEEEQ